MGADLPPAPMYCAHMQDDGQCELANCEEHECHLGDEDDVETFVRDTLVGRVLVKKAWGINDVR